MWDVKQASSVAGRTAPSTAVAPCARRTYLDSDPVVSLPSPSHELLSAAARRIWTLRTELAARDRERDKVAELRSELEAARVARDSGLHPLAEDSSSHGVVREDLQRQVKQLQGTLAAGTRIADSLAEVVGSPQHPPYQATEQSESQPQFSCDVEMPPQLSVDAAFDAQESLAADDAAGGRRYVADMQHDTVALSNNQQKAQPGIKPLPLPSLTLASSTFRDPQDAAERGGVLAASAPSATVSAVAVRSPRSPGSEHSAADGSAGAASFMTAADGSEARFPEAPLAEAHAGVQRWRCLAAALAACRRRRYVRAGAYAEEDSDRDAEMEAAELGHHHVPPCGAKA